MQGIECATGDYVLPLGAGTSLAPDALYHFAKAVLAQPDATVFYGDEDRINRKGVRSHPGSSHAGTLTCFWPMIICHRPV
jgi:hypothetical protein